MSIRARLLLVTAAVALLALVGADIATYASLRSFLYGQVDTGLELSHRTVEAAVSAGPTGSGTNGSGSTPRHLQGGGNPHARGPAGCPTFEGREVDAEGLNPGTFIEVRSAANRTLWRCILPSLGSSSHRPTLPARITGFQKNTTDFHEPTVYFNATSRRGGAAYRVRASILRSGPAVGGQLIVAVPATGTTRTLADLRSLESAAAAAAILAALFLGWWLVRASLHPLRDIERTAEAISAGQLSERVRGDDARTEVGHVARAFNVMLERIESAFAARDRTEAELRHSEERMRRFVADASHELRTPLAAVRAYAELFDRGAAERPEDLHRLLEGIQRESRRMTMLVEDLLLLTRLDEGSPLQSGPIDLVALAAEAASTARTVGPEWPVVLRATEPVEVLGDELRLRQVLDNLLANVRQHTPLGTTTTLHVACEGRDASVSVSDDGPGLSKEGQERIFERFFRADPSRSRAHGGAGLGLAIVEAIVRAHGGHVTVSASPSGGAEFTVRLPAAGATGAVGDGTEDVNVDVNVDQPPLS